MDELKQKIKEIEKYLKSYYVDEPTGHNLDHLKRVYNNAIKIQKKEGGDLYIISIASILHDVHRVMGKDSFVETKDSLPIIKEILKKSEVLPENIKKIIDVIKHHTNKKSMRFYNIETSILQDADTLDALGEIGLMRTQTYCKARNIPLVNKNYPLNCKEYIPDINPISTCHYIYRTMIVNGKKMKTNTGKKMAEGKIEILYNFLKEKLGEDFEKELK